MDRHPAPRTARPSAPSDGLTGYLHQSYADSLAELGRPRLLPRSGGWILERDIPGSSRRDAMGCYPLFVCQDWSQLHLDLDDLGTELVSLSVVTDPFGEYNVEDLRECFSDVVMPFKHHFVIDLSRELESYVSSHHRRYARKALQDVSVEECQDPPQLLDEWVSLYGVLIRRHNARGISAFSRQSFAGQLRIPGIMMLRAREGQTAVGITLWYTMGRVGYYHLGACSERGYELRASFALFWKAIESLAGRGVRWLNLGAGAGLTNSSGDGLSRFKRGWSTGTRPAYFCGRIFDPAAYERLTALQGAERSDYFPGYRVLQIE